MLKPVAWQRFLLSFILDSHYSPSAAFVVDNSCLAKQEMSKMFNFLNSRPSSEQADDVYVIKSPSVSRQSQILPHNPLNTEKTSFSTTLDAIQKFPHSMLQLIVPSVHLPQAIILPMYFSHESKFEVQPPADKWEIPLELYRLTLLRVKIVSKTLISAKITSPAHEVPLLPDFIRTHTNLFEDTMIHLDKQYVVI